MKKFLAYIYIISWVLYELQDVIYSSGIVSKLALFFYLGISIVYFFKCLSELQLTNYIKGLNLLLLLFTIYGTVLILSGDKLTLGAAQVPVASYSYLKYIYLSLLPFFPFYYFFNKGILNKDNLTSLLVLFLIVAIVCFYDQQKNSILNAELLGLDSTENNNNAGYIFLSLIPGLAIFTSKPRFQYVILGVCSIFIILSMKRGAMLIGSVIIALFIFRNNKSLWKTNRLRVVILSLGVIGIMYYAISYLSSTSDYFINRYYDTMNGDSSHRDELYTYFLNHFTNNNNVLQQFFGEGANATIKIFYNYAHNDWIEILINQGVLGVFCFIWFWLCYYKDWRISKKLLSNNVALGIGLFFLSFLLKTLFSMSYASISFGANCFLAYYMTELSDAKHNYKIKINNSVE